MIRRHGVYRGEHLPNVAREARTLLGRELFGEAHRLEGAADAHHVTRGESAHEVEHRLRRGPRDRTDYPEIDESNAAVGEHEQVSGVLSGRGEPNT